MPRFPSFQQTAPNAPAPFSGQPTLAPARRDEPLPRNEAIRLILLISVAGWGLLFSLVALVL